MISDEANRRVATAHNGWSATFYHHRKKQYHRVCAAHLGLNKHPVGLDVLFGEDKSF